MVRSTGFLGLALALAVSPFARAAGTITVQAAGTITVQTTGAGKGVGVVGAADDTHAFALGAKDDGQGNSTPVMLLTSDGGTTWTLGPAQGLTSSAMLVLNDVRCLSAKKCLALASSIDMSVGVVIQNNLITSTDVGKTWVWPAKTQLKTWTFTRMNVVTDQDIWLSSGATVIDHTTDGGKTFQWKVPKVDTTQYMAIVGTAFIDGQTGFAVNSAVESDSNGNETAIKPAGALLKTTDGATTWTALFTGKTEAYDRIQMLSAQEGWLVGHTLTAPILRKTTDGGQTWDDVTIPAPGGTVSAIKAIDSFLMFDGTTGLLVGNVPQGQSDYSHVIYEIRGGALVEVSPDPLSNAGYVGGLGCTASRTCWMGSSNGSIVKWVDGSYVPPSDATPGSDVAGGDTVAGQDAVGGDAYVPQDLNGYWDNQGSGKSGCVAGAVPGAATAIPALLGLLVMAAARRRRD